jgi:hypothetical protein
MEKMVINCKSLIVTKNAFGNFTVSKLHTKTPFGSEFNTIPNIGEEKFKEAFKKVSTVVPEFQPIPGLQDTWVVLCV